MSQQKVDDEREKLRQHFLTLSDEQQVNGWDDMWKKQVTPWDRQGQSNPALVDALAADKTAIEIQSPFKTGADGGKVRKRAFVPGCGRGPDVLLFASYGFNAYGLDASETAIKAARELAQKQDEKFPVQSPEHGRGETTFVCADFFNNDFLSQIGASSDTSGGPFDIIYDYTFLCALPPSLRPKWAARMSQLLSPTGILICMEFPLGKDPKAGGPPHGLQDELYDKLFDNPGQDVKYGADGRVDADQSSEKSGNAMVRIETWKPDRVFEGQEKSTMVSLWRHVQQ
jgi:methyl halide transferase